MSFDTNQIEQFSKTNAALAELKKDYEIIPEFNSKKDENYKSVQQGLTKLQKLRKAVTEAGDKEAAKHREIVKQIVGERDRIVNAIKDIEEPIRKKKKEVDEREAREKEERIARLQEKVDGILSFVAEAKGKTSEEISGIIEAVTEIDTSKDFYDLTNEATKARADVLDELGEMLAERVQFEASEKQRLEAEAQAKELKAKQDLENRVTKLRIIPAHLIGKPSKDIQAKLNSLEGMEIKEEEFKERTYEVRELKTQIQAQLKSMVASQKIVEDAQAKGLVEEESPEYDHKWEGKYNDDPKHKDAAALAGTKGKKAQEETKERLQTPKEIEEKDPNFIDDIHCMREGVNQLKSYTFPPVSTNKGLEIQKKIKNELDNAFDYALTLLDDQ